MDLACRGLPFTLIYCDHSKCILIWMVMDLHTQLPLTLKGDTIKINVQLISGSVEIKIHLGECSAWARNVHYLSFISQHGAALKGSFIILPPLSCISQEEGEERKGRAIHGRAEGKRDCFLQPPQADSVSHEQQGGPDDF